MIDAQSIEAIMAFLREFGFTTLIAIWALWQLTSAYKKLNSFEVTLKEIAETLDSMKDISDKNSNIQNETLTTLKILKAISDKKNNGGGA